MVKMDDDHNSDNYDDNNDDDDDIDDEDDHDHENSQVTITWTTFKLGPPDPAWWKIYTINTGR